MQRVTTLQVCTLNAYWLGLSFMWNSLHIIILPAVLLHLVPDNQKNTYLGLLTFFGLLIAMVVQPISGTISDHWVSRWGRRRPLILLGTAFDFLFLAFLGWSGGILWIAIGYIGLQFSSNIAHGPLQGLMPDTVPPEQRGWAAGFKNLMDLAGVIVSSVIVGRLLSPETRYPVGVIILVSVILAIGAAITLIGVREKPALSWTPKSIGKSLLDTFRVDLRCHRSYAWLIVSRLFFLSGIYGLQSFIQYYIRDVLTVPNPIQLTGNLLAIITISLIAFAMLGGYLGDRLGHKRISLVASLVGGFGCLLLPWARTPESLMVVGSFVGVGIGLFLTSNWAIANVLAPADQEGKFLGLTNLATAGAGAIGRLEGPLIDIVNNRWPGEWWGYIGLFLVGGVCIFISAGLLLRIPLRLASHPT